MRVLGACSLGGAGHLQPLRTILEAARRNGADVRVAGPESLAALVEQARLDFVACGEPPEEAVAPIREQLPTAPPAEASVLGNRELFGRLATAAMLPGLEQAVAEWRPDLVVRDPCEYASAVIAHREGVSVAQVAIGLAGVEWASLAVASPALEEHQAGLTDAIRRTVYLTRFPAPIDPSPFPSTRRFREVPAVPRPLPDWWDGSTAPLVYVSFGTVLGHMSWADTAFRVALAAVAGLDARVLLTVGRHVDLGRLVDVPQNVHVESWVDQADVFAEADLVVCHGGSGTAFGALAAGVPLVIVPMFADQFANADAIAAAGAAVSLAAGREGTRRPFDGVDSRRLADAVAATLVDEDRRRVAQEVAAEMATAPVVDDVLAGLAGDPEL